ncbi:hypothetical protein [Pedobacter sp. SYSU D00535]|uniref:hypothetical protein n=1 Tax=Pedobacter sp. SYSU D00535 TaxID=2810308 RepID=UPI001A967452|nr:hypothetical protein [Pedobacter sp. SYSU D00535]
MLTKQHISSVDPDEEDLISNPEKTELEEYEEQLEKEIFDDDDFIGNLDEEE